MDDNNFSMVGNVPVVGDCKTDYDGDLYGLLGRRFGCAGKMIGSYG